MQEISEGVLENFNKKNKEYLDANSRAIECSENQLFGPLGETILFLIDFMTDISQKFEGLKTNNKRYIEEIELKDSYPKLVYFYHISLQRPHLERSLLFQYNQKFFFKANSEALFDFSSCFPDEMSFKKGDLLQIKSGEYDEQ